MLAVVRSGICIEGDHEGIYGDSWRVEGKARYNTSSVALFRYIRALKLFKWSIGLVDSSYMSSCSTLKCLGSGFVIIWASNSGSMMSPRSSSLAKARPQMVSICWSNSWNLWSSLASLAACASKCIKGDRAKVDPSSNYSKWHRSLFGLGLRGAPR